MRSRLGESVMIYKDPESEPLHDDSRIAEDDASLLKPVDVEGYCTVIAHGGLHFRKMNDRVLERVFHRPEFMSVSRLVCMTVHAPGTNRTSTSKGKDSRQRRSSMPVK